ncbi:hypothetical protein A3L04_04535 [Thermococcus chitonophagus]|uniref:Uncharacterized protein n=1 Tax=Thermococcus chitonophagus TaxID=54262 RepID=A0A160VVB1_9EURY|nr:hypothetical protein [Thermococcus chitonophagus]ASJ16392.1 hypothetical protein A3L04_04535 [Thermococcus chitonophagus]CUX78616.1 hypothetical protein CHITON_1837 [Thermococcus chitonophagus]
MNVLLVVLLVSVLLNIIIGMLYFSAKRNPYYVVYDEETKSQLKRRVLHLKEDLESELEEFDVSEWEKQLEKSLEEEIKGI